VVVSITDDKSGHRQTAHSIAELSRMTNLDLSELSHSALVGKSIRTVSMTCYTLNQSDESHCPMSCWLSIRSNQGLVCYLGIGH